MKSRGNPELEQFIEILRHQTPQNRLLIRSLLIHQLYLCPRAHHTQTCLRYVFLEALRFFLPAGLASFALLLIMPYHPMAIPAAFGGGLALSTIGHSIFNLLINAR